MYQCAYAWQSKEPNQPKYNNNDGKRQPNIHNKFPILLMVIDEVKRA
jgi:hypothetical protein